MEKNVNQPMETRMAVVESEMKHLATKADLAKFEKRITVGGVIGFCVLFFKDTELVQKILGAIS